MDRETSALTRNDPPPENPSRAGAMVGPWRRPVQMLAQQSHDDRDSIHDDSTAQRLGLSAGTIEGPTHFTQFEPLCAMVWGDHWFETGCISAHFRAPVFAGERVRAHLHHPPGAPLAEIWMVKEDGAEVLRGSANIGDAGPTALERRLAELAPPGRLELFEGVAIGERSHRIAVEIRRGEAVSPLYPFSIDAKLEALTEPGVRDWALDRARDRQHAPALPLELVSVLLCSKDPTPFAIPAGAVGLFADQQIRLLSGPLRVGVGYELEREVVAITASRRTEGLWIRTVAREAASQTVVAEMLLNAAYIRPSALTLTTSAPATRK